MKKIGFDWGTTTTSVCFFQPEKNTFDYLRFGGNNLDSFPTVIVYRTKNGKEDRNIGVIAKKRMYSAAYDAYDNIKLKLDFDAKNKHNREKSIYEVARDFIGTVIGEFVHNYGNVPEGIVFTVPDSWGKDIFRHPSLFLLEQIFEDIGFDTDTQISFCSEPVAAAAYYCGEVCRGIYDGMLLVVDFGGGTLDLTLCRVENADRIVVMKRCGDTGGENEEGCAGEAFDTEVAKRIADSNDLGLSPDDPDFFRLKGNLEEAKIACAVQIEKLLKDYYSASGNERRDISSSEAFVVMDADYNEYSVSVGDIVESFDKVNKYALTKCFHEIMAYCRETDIRTDDVEHFRVILTGGFSNLYCVEASLRQILGAPLCGPDSRFDAGISRESRSTAIAHGAAMIAEGKMTVDILLQKDVGLIYFDVFDQEEKRATLLKHTDRIRNLREPIYFDRLIYGTYVKKDTEIAIYIEEGETSSIVYAGLEQLHMAGTDKCYKLGLSIGKRQTLFLHSLDIAGGEHRQIPIGI